MKTFKQFIILCEKYSEEHAHRKLWNYFISHPEHGKDVRDAILNKDYEPNYGMAMAAMVIRNINTVSLKLFKMLNCSNNVKYGTSAPF